MAHILSRISGTNWHVGMHLRAQLATAETAMQGNHGSTYKAIMKKRNSVKFIEGSATKKTTKHKKNYSYNKPTKTLAPTKIIQTKNITIYKKPTLTS